MKKTPSNNKEFFFYFYFFIQKNMHFVRKHVSKNLIYIITFMLQFFVWQALENAVIKHQFQYRYALVL